jgi:hypothetical protein
MGRVLGDENSPDTAGRMPGPAHLSASVTAAVCGPAGQPDSDVSHWSTEQKLIAAVRCSLPYLTEDLREQIAVMLSPKGIALLLATALVQFVPVVGEALDAAVAAYIWAAFGWQVVSNTKRFFVGAVTANNCEDLQEAGHALSQVVIAIGVMRFLELLHDSAGTSAEEAAEQSPVSDLAPEEPAPREEMAEEDAADLGERFPLTRNPRELAKHPGQITVERLVEEVKSKGFQQVTGEGGLQGIYLRRIRVKNEEFYEAVRIDKPHGKPWQPTGKTMDSVETSKNAAFRRDHAIMSDPVTPQGKALGDQLSGGRFSGSFAHWHHEMFPAKPGALERYLKPMSDKDALAMGLRKLDQSGKEVTDWHLRMKDKNAAGAASAAKLKAKLDE